MGTVLKNTLNNVFFRTVPKNTSCRYRMMEKYIYPLKALPKEVCFRAGGKARSLARMMQSTKLPVPEGYVILCDAFEGAGLTKEAAEEVRKVISSLDRRVTYAVRSSAMNEDGENASFAGQYETITDVTAEEIEEAIGRVAASAESFVVKSYMNSRVASEAAPDNPIAVVIQRFVKADFAGVLFTADPVTGREEFMVGNYVKGAGEMLVSGAANAEVFALGAIRYSYEGPKEFARYGKKLCRYARVIRALYGRHMDIEWAVADGKLYLLQARPVTTLSRLNMDTYEVNGSSGSKILTKTNVGEIFMQPVSPMTFSVLEKINDILGLPDWLDNVCGQPYMNISVLVSFLMAFGVKKEKAVESLKGLVGTIPEGVEMPVSPYDRRALFRKMFVLIFPKKRSKLSRAQKRKMVDELPQIAKSMIGEIRGMQTEEELILYWEQAMVPKLIDCMSAIMGRSGTSLLPLFRTRAEIAKVAGEEMAERLTGGCLGIMESMKALFLLGDVRSGKMSKEEYLSVCGQRCPNEMELMAPRPYEDPEYVDRLLASSGAAPADPYEMQAAQKRAYEAALAEFKEAYPGKSRWIDRKIGAFVAANTFREDLRSKGVWIFCVFREYLLSAGRITGLGDDIFMFTFDEVFEFLRGDRALAKHIPARRASYEKYLRYEAFPNLVIGSFDPDKWMADPARRRDMFPADAGSDAGVRVKGFPGASGVVRGRVHVILDVSEIESIMDGEVLVTSATNVGWTPVFPKVAAIVTDIGAPLSHAAIIARECGIPAVVGCGNATTLLHTGDEVIVDGGAGTVTVV